MLIYMTISTLSTLWDDVRDSNRIEFEDVSCAVLGSIAILLMCPVLFLLDVLASPLEGVTYIIYRVIKRKKESQ